MSDAAPALELPGAFGPIAMQDDELARLRAENADLTRRLQTTQQQMQDAVRHAESMAGVIETHEREKGQDQCNAMDAWGENERLKGEAIAARLERDEAKAALERAQAALAAMTAQATADRLARDEAKVALAKAALA